MAKPVPQLEHMLLRNYKADKLVGELDRLTAEGWRVVGFSVLRGEHCYLLLEREKKA